jgi:transcriptional regulator with XRE-family HTH domain
MKDRITQFLVNENISSAEFADKIGVQRSSVSHILNERNSPSTSFIQKMLSAYKNLNPRWLLLGEGNMFSSQEIINQEPSLFPYTQEDDSTSALNYKSKDETVKNQTFVNNNVLQNQQLDFKSIKSREQIEQKEVNENVDKTSDFKHVERIILFHKDKTFTEYTPSK